MITFIGLAIALAAAAYGMFYGISLIYEVVGVLATLMAFFMFPFVITIAPWYGAIMYGDMKPFIIVYGGGMAGLIIAAYGSR